MASVGGLARGRARYSPWPGKPGLGGATRLAAASAAALIAALYVSTHTALASPQLGVALALGAALTAWFAVSVRYEVTLAAFALYIGLLDGFIKLRTNNPQATFGRDILLYAIVLGAAGRLFIDRKTIRLPPLAPWVLGFIVIALLQVFNPNTANVTKALAGVRQQLEFVPLYFFGYLVLNSTSRLRNLLLLLAVVAAINGVVGLIQSQLTPEQLGNWGPGYKQRLTGEGDVAARVFFVDSGERVRPFGLGSDVGFGGNVGLLALPGILAFVTLGGLGRRIPPMVVLGIGAAIGVVSSQGRTVVIGTVLALLAFFFLGLAGKQAVRTVAAASVAVLLAVVVLPAVFSGTENRYGDIAPDQVVSTAYNYRIDDLSYMQDYVTRFPLGAGLGTVGPARVFGGLGNSTGGINGETQFNFLILELGLPGLLLMTGLAIKVIALTVRRLPRVPDRETRTYLAGIFAPFIAVFMTGFAGPSTTAPPFAPYFWLVVGIAAYWLYPPQRARHADIGTRDLGAGLGPPAQPSAGRDRATDGRLPRARGAIAASAAADRGMSEDVRSARNFAVSICLWSRGEPQVLRRELERIAASTVPVHEVLVSTPEPVWPEDVMRAFPGVRWLARSAPNAVEAWNDAAVEATGSHLLFLDDTVTLDADFLHGVQRRWRELAEPARGGVLFAGSQMQGVRRVLPMEQDWPGRPTRSHKRRQPIRSAIITSAVVPRHAFVALRFDPTLDSDLAGLDFVARAVEAGSRVVPCPEAANWGPPTPRRHAAALDREAARILAAVERRAETNSQHGIAPGFYAAAAAQLYLTAIRDHGPRGVAMAARALHRARHHRAVTRRV